MSLFSSLTNRIFLASALVAVTTTGVAVWYVGTRATREAESELTRGLADAASLVAQQQRALATRYVVFARLLADLPKLKGAVATQDPTTVAPIAADYRQQVGVDLLLVTDRHGRVLARGGERIGDPAKASVEDALAGREVLEFRAHPRGILQVVTVPISIGLATPEMLGSLSLGVLLDAGLADQFKRATHSEVAFVLDGTVRAATFPVPARSALSALTGQTTATSLRLGDAEYVGQALPLRPPLEAGIEAPDRSAGSIFVLQSRTERLRFLRTVNAALIVAALAAVLLATVVGYLVARTITRPLGAITAAMREVATTGDLTRKITLRGPAVWQDEDARLLATTFNTLTDSIGRFQREAAQKERLLSLGRLSTVIAHEVRNPLMIIKAALRSFRPEAPASDIREAVRDIDGEVDRLNRIVHDVLDFARPPAFSLEPVNLVGLCRDAAEAASAAGDGPRVAADLPAADAVVTTDGDRLRTALVNILTNARQAVAAREAAGPEGDGAAEEGASVQMRLERRPPGRICITVADRGVGIRPEELAQVFEPYFTTRRSGTGLGLPIARNIVEGLGGTLRVRSSDGGTTVEIDLPDSPVETASA
jgi:signal transduction histidine kinase